MASITSLTSGTSSTSSIYGNRNILSGLASGMDTETMIENAVYAYKLKIQTLQQKRTKVEWQQEAYRSIIDKAVNFSNKYTSYTSSTNLLSSSFFSNAVNTTTLGTYANKVTATGKTTSDIQINAVKQLATAASYTVSGMNGVGQDFSSIVGNKSFDLSEMMDVSNVSGSLSLQYGGTNGTSFDLKFDELDIYSSPDELADAIREKLGDLSYSYTKNGVQETVKGSDVIDVKVDSNGTITFSDKTSAGNSVYISSASGDIKSTLGVSTGSGANTLRAGSSSLSRKMTTRSYLADKSLTLNLDGVSKSISMNDVLDKVTGTSGSTQNEEFQAALQAEVDKAFGAGKVNVSRDDDGVLSFKPLKDGSTLTVSGTAAKSLGFTSGDGNFLNTSKTLKDLLGEDSEMLSQNRLRGTFKNYDGKPTQKTTSSGTVYYVDDAGNRVDKDGYRITDTDDPIYDFELNGTHIEVTGDTTLESLINSINSNADAGVKVSYSKLTNEFKFTATETGSNSKVELGGLAKAMFGPSSDVEVNNNFAENYGFDAWLRDGETERITVQFGVERLSFNITTETTMEEFAERLHLGSGGQLLTSYNAETGQLSVVSKETGEDVEFTIYDSWDDSYEREIQPVANYTAGKDAIMDVTINGKQFSNLTRSSNNFDLDGLNVTVKGTFKEDDEDYEPVTFETTTDSDKIVEAIASMINDYNELATELKNAYSTQPNYNSSNARYEPLTADDEAGMTESEINAYNEKAKQGILFGDTTLSSFYAKLLNAIQPGGTDGQTLREIGITTSYSDGMTTLTLDEDKLRAALDSDPDKVKDAFTKSTESGSSSNGLMQTLQNTLNTYAKTTGEPKGVLIVHAGSVKAPTSLNSNSLKSQIDSIDSEIERWQDKMSDQIDRYTTKFTNLELLISEMNSQASALMGLMGGDASY